MTAAGESGASKVLADKTTSGPFWRRWSKRVVAVPRPDGWLSSGPINYVTILTHKTLPVSASGDHPGKSTSLFVAKESFRRNLRDYKSLVKLGGDPGDTFLRAKPLSHYTRDSIFERPVSDERPDPPPAPEPIQVEVSGHLTVDLADGES